MTQRKNETHTEYLARMREYNSTRYQDPAVREDLKARSRRYGAEHPDQIKERRSDPEYKARVAERLRQRYTQDAEYREKAKELSRQGQQKYKDAHQAWRQRMKAADPTAWKTADEKRGRRYRDNLRRLALEAYGGQCSCCGEKRSRLLAVARVDSTLPRLWTPAGQKVGGSRLYAWLRQNGYPSGFQVLCHNCNFARGHFGHCPHKGPLARYENPSPYQRQAIALRDEVMQQYGGLVCKCCGETNPDFLTLDHIENNGKEHVDAKGRRLNGGDLYRWLQQQGYPEGLQVLCHNCNMAKAFYGECPHEAEKRQP